MRTTIRLNDRLLQAAKRAAVDRRISLTRLIEEALQEKLSGRPVTGRRPRIVTFRGNGLQPGIDLDDSAALTEAMDG